MMDLLVQNKQKNISLFIEGVFVFVFAIKRRVYNLKNKRIDFERLQQIKRFAHGPTHLVFRFY